MTRSIRRNARQKGQSLIEFALVLPIVATILLLVAYFGKAMVDRQNLLIAARTGARERAIASLADKADVLAGKGVMTQGNGGGRANDLSQQLMKNSECVAPALKIIPSSKLKPIPVGSHATAYVAEQTLTADAGGTTFPIKAGVGFILYSQKVTAPVAGIEPLGKSLNRLWGGRFAGINVSAQASMPGGLPAHHPMNVGVLELNSWIGDILNDPNP